MLRLYIGLYNQFVNLIPIQTFQINSILSIRLIWNAKQFNSIRASSEDLKDLLAPLAVTPLDCWVLGAANAAGLL